MRVFPADPETQQKMAVIVPLFALAISMFLVYPAWGRYGDLQSKIEAQRKELNTLKTAAPPPPGPISPTANDQASEPSEFLGMITQIASAANCSLMGLDVAAEVKPKEGSVVRPVRARVEVEGRFPAVRHFLYLLAHAPRLLVVTDMGLATSASTSRLGAPPPIPGLVRATVEVERYVVPPAPPSS